MTTKLAGKITMLVFVFMLLVSSVFAGVMMEGFYWNVPSSWYTTMQAQAAGLSNMAGGYGINRIWFPPPSKGQSGGYSMGYDIYDYYDLGKYNSEGTIPTLFGTQAQLKAAIATYKSYNIECMADIVLNHRTGGDLEYNPNTSSSTWTDFSHVASSTCLWHYNEFHPSTYEYSDEGTFGGYPDVCHVTPYSYGHAFYDQEHWVQWLQSTANAGFNGGWRFDDVIAYHPWVCCSVQNFTGNPFCVGEYWDTNVTDLDNWISASGGNISVFDFPLYYTLSDICNATDGSANLPNVFNNTLCYAARNPIRAVTFAANHDIDQIVSDKMIAYAFIMTYQGYACINWKDYFVYGLSTSGGASPVGWGNGINQLLWCHEKLAAGAPTIDILADNNSQCVVYDCQGHSSSSPGYIVIINTNPTNWQGITVTTNNSYLKGQNLKAYAWSSTIAGQNSDPNNQNCSSGGTVTVWAAPRGYAVYSVNGL
jgi:alpha-amylase